MKISVPLQPLIDAARVDTLALLKQIRPGQVLQARVVTPTNAGVAKLLIGTTELLAKTRVSLTQGETLSLKVEKGLPRPELKIQYDTVQQPVRRLLLNAMSRQLAPGDVQQSLRQLPAQLLVRSPIAQQVVRALLPEAPPPQQVTAQTVRHAMQHSGLFFERNLANELVLPQDRKLQLLQLLRLFTARPVGPGGTEAPPPKEGAEQRASPAEQLLNRLIRLVEGSLSRIQSHQATSLGNDEPNRLVWQFEMPVQLPERQEQLQLRVEREDRETAEEGLTGQTWKVDIDFNFDNLGAIFSRISLNDGKVSAAFWSQRETTASVIERAIPRLESALQKAGLEVTAISSLIGPPPRPPSPTENLLDEHA